MMVPAVGSQDSRIAGDLLFLQQPSGERKKRRKKNGEREKLWLQSHRQPSKKREWIL